jgi:hypothetical protein
VASLVLATAGPASAGNPDPGPAGSGVIVDWSGSVRVQTSDCETGPVGRRVLVLGDSITVRTRDVLTRTLTSAGWSVCLDARAGQPTSGALDGYQAAGAFPAYVDVIVMATGSNDIFDPGRFPAQVSRARAYATGRPLLWVTAWVARTRVPATLARHDAANASRVNAVVWARIGRANRAAVIDWHATLAAGRGRSAIYLVDGVHTSTLGGRQRSVVIATALRPYLR